jgi:hypothetical protein
MNLNDCYEILSFKEKYNDTLFAFEYKINTELYELLTNPSNANKFLIKSNSDSESNNNPILIEFYDLRNDFYTHKHIGTKYICKYVFDRSYNSEQNVDQINFTLRLQNQVNNKLSKPMTNEEIKLFCSELYEQLKTFEITNIVKSDEYKSLTEQKKKIILMKNCLKNYYANVSKNANQIDKSQFFTDLYRYYLKNLDKMIENGNHYNNFSKQFNQFNQFSQFYDFLTTKYGIPNNNFKLDYLEYYFLNNMGLQYDFEVKFDSEGYLYFVSETCTLTFQMERGRYVSSYYPKYTIFIKDNETNNIIKKIGFDAFDSDRNLERHYDNLLHFIEETVDVVFKFD